MSMFQRPAPQYEGSFADLVALPEVAGKTLGEMVGNGRALRIWCRACGRETLFTAHGLKEMFPTRLALTVEAFTLALRCEACGAKEAQASGGLLEAHDPRSVIVRREHHRAPRIR